MSGWRRRCGVFAIACACLLLAPRIVAAAHHTVVGDFDGAVRHDRATLNPGGHASEIRVWLSTTNATTVIHSSAHIGAIAARDLDGDHRDELIGRESLQLQIWTVREQRFQQLHHENGPVGSFGKPAPDRVEEPPDDAPAADATAGASSVAVLLSPRPRAPDLLPEWLASQVSAGFRSAQLLAPVAPRPPPVI